VQRRRRLNSGFSYPAPSERRCHAVADACGCRKLDRGADQDAYVTRPSASHWRCYRRFDRVAQRHAWKDIASWNGRRIRVLQCRT
jgi:hypothetical protein